MCDTAGIVGVPEVYVFMNGCVISAVCLTSLIVEYSSWDTINLDQKSSLNDKQR